VHVEQAFVDEAVAFARKHYPKEVGSSLVGSYSDDGWTATILSSAPLPQDSRAGRAWFVRGVAGLKSYFGKVFARSAGQTHYVGEWHVHPDGQPDPSGQDDRDMMAIVEDPEARCPECILVIVGYSKSRARIRVFVYSTKNGRVDLNLVSAE
jgi:integrative and conjugative element protein (TIGR02256 family)